MQWLSARLDAHQINAVCGPLEGGAFLALAVADVLDTAFVPAGRPPGPGPGQPGYRLPPGMGQRVAGWRVAIVDDAINAGTAVTACFGLLRDSGAVPVAAGTLLGLGQGAPTIIPGAPAQRPVPGPHQLQRATQSVDAGIITRAGLQRPRLAHASTAVDTSAPGTGPSRIEPERIELARIGPGRIELAPWCFAWLTGA